MRGVLRVLVTLALAASSTGYLLASKRVTLAEEGKTRTIDTFAPTVGAALDRVGVKLRPGDRIIPSPRAQIAASHRIEVRRAKPVVLILNGVRSEHRVTGLEVGEVLAELGVEAQGAYVHPAIGDPVAPSDEIVVSRPVDVVVEHDGVSTPVKTNALTAGSVLRQIGIVLGQHDRVEPSIVAPPAQGAVFKVVRVSEAIEKVASPIKFKRVTERSDELYVGMTRVKSPGVDGSRVRSYRVVYENGRVKSRSPLTNEVARQPVNEVTLVGARRPSLQGPVRGTESGIASWYKTPPTRCTSRYGDLTAAHKTLPFGTVVKVTSLTSGRSVTVIICDRGPYVEGRVIDLNRAAFAELAPASTGLVRVKLEW